MLCIGTQQYWQCTECYGGWQNTGGERERETQKALVNGCPLAGSLFAIPPIRYSSQAPPPLTCISETMPPFSTCGSCSGLTSLPPASANQHTQSHTHTHTHTLTRANTQPGLLCGYKRDGMPVVTRREKCSPTLSLREDKQGPREGWSSPSQEMYESSSMVFSLASQAYWYRS